MSTDAPDHSERFVSMIQRVREQVQQAQSQYHAARVQGSVDTETKRQLAWAAMLYHGVLEDYDDQSHVDDLWQTESLQTLAEVADKQAVIEQPAPGDSSATRTRTVPAVLQLEARTIYEATKALDRIANRLGFAAKATKRVEKVNPDPV